LAGQSFVDQIGDAVGFGALIGFFRLIQSQGQTWPRSTALGQIDPDGGIQIVLLEVFAQFGLGFRGDFDHKFILLSAMIASYTF
jgi:hypothetical protein